MQQVSGKDIILSAFMGLLQGDSSPIHSVDYMYLASEETVRKDVEKHNALVDKENKEHPGEWGMNKIEFNPAEYRMAGDKYVVIYTKCITPYNISFRDFVRGFLELMDDEHIPLGYQVICSQKMNSSSSTTNPKPRIIVDFFSGLINNLKNKTS